MVVVHRITLPSDIPVYGCELTPHVVLRRWNNTFITVDVPERAPLDGHFLRYKWYRIQNDKKIPMCSIHPSEQAKVKCIACPKVKLPDAMRYHCSSQCFADAWPRHRVLHERAAKESGNQKEEYGLFNSTGSTTSLSPSQSSNSLSNSATPFHPTAVIQLNGQTLFEVGRSKTYTPAADDVGHTLRFECVVVNAETKSSVGNAVHISTSRVIPTPCPPPRHIISVSDSDARNSADLTFSVLSYNILSESHATNGLYGYCPSFALSWPYRRQNLLSEIVGYHADIICLQEVQKDHFEEFFKPKLGKHGYEALFVRKSTTKDFSGNENTVDGCATFFCKDRFSLVKKYEVRFNEAAHSMTDAMPAAQKKTALARLIKDNVALTLVLEAKFGVQGSDSTAKHQLVCVANTHVNIAPELNDVKLWQVHTLVKGLEEVSNCGDIPMLVCGDFNSLPGSATHAFLAMATVEPTHPDVAFDPLGIVHPISRLTHLLPLVSAYSSFARTVAKPVRGLEQLRERLDPTTNEPLFTNVTRDFIGTRDYIFYGADLLTVEGLLELLDEGSYRNGTALPSPVWSSDHIALLARFRYKPNTRR